MHARVAPPTAFAAPATVPRGLRASLAVALLTTLVVVGASAYIRFVETGGAAALPVARGLHRVSATLAAIAVIVAFVLAWRLRNAPLRSLTISALVLTLSLAAIGIAFGTTPPPVARAGNLLGGLALAGVLAFTLGRLGPALEDAHTVRLARRALGLGIAQALLGAWLAAHPGAGPDAVLLGHVLLGLASAALALRGGLRLFGAVPALGVALCLAALAGPLAGTASALFELPPAVALLHPVAAATLLALLALTTGRTR